MGAGERQARANLLLARKAVDGLYTQLAEELYAVPRMQPLQRKFLLQALEFYEEFSTQRGSDPETASRRHAPADESGASSTSSASVARPPRPSAGPSPR